VAAVPGDVSPTPLKKNSNPVCYTPSSEPFRIYIDIVDKHKHNYLKQTCEREVDGEVKCNRITEQFGAASTPLSNVLDVFKRDDLINHH
jgi:hypothetical protein